MPLAGPGRVGGPVRFPLDVLDGQIPEREPAGFFHDIAITPFDAGDHHAGELHPQERQGAQVAVGQPALDQDGAGQLLPRRAVLEQGRRRVIDQPRDGKGRWLAPVGHLQLLLSGLDGAPAGKRLARARPLLGCRIGGDRCALVTVALVVLQLDVEIELLDFEVLAGLEIQAEAIPPASWRRTIQP